MALSGKERIRSEAREWFRLLSDAHSGADRARFEEWVASDPQHRAAYDKVAANLSDADALLRQSSLGRSRDLSRAFSSRLSLKHGLAAASIAALVVAGAYGLQGTSGSARPLQAVMLATGSEPKTVRLADGSRIALSPVSQVSVRLSRTERLAEVKQGKAHLTVVSEERPFIIVAGDVRINADPGEFDAAFDGGAGRVVPAPRPEPALTLVTPSERAARSPAAASAVALQFNGEPLALAVERINQVGAGPRIEVDLDVASLKVTGVFQRGGSADLARSIAAAFRLAAVDTPSGAVRLTRLKK